MLMKKYRFIAVILIFALAFTGCGISVADAGDLNWNLNYQESQLAADPTAPTAPKNPYGPVDFAMEGDYMTCLSGKSALAIDVSEWQTQIDWQKVAAAGVQIVMLRVGWRGSEEGKLFEDELFKTHYDGATAAGLQVGGYFFSQAVTVEEAKEEAELALKILDGRKLQMPLAMDWEQLGGEKDRTGDMDARTLTDITVAFCDTVKAAGYDPMLYFNPDVASRLLYLGELSDYKFWLAMYSNEMNYAYKIHMWQYTNAGKVDGINGDVDLNLYLTYE